MNFRKTYEEPALQMVGLNVQDIITESSIVNDEPFAGEEDEV